MKCFLLCLYFSLLPALCFAQATTSWNGQPGGKYIPSRGTLNALIIFAQFPDDSLDTKHPEWPKGEPPQRLHTWIDSVETAIPTPHSLTDYFHQMSLGSFRVIGKTRSVVAPHSRQEYRNQRFSRRDIHRELIEQLDSTLDFAEFDQWDCKGEYNHRQRPDSIVDMLIIIWRNITDDIPAEHGNMRDAFGFIGDEADLGFGAPIAVDNGERSIQMGFGVHYRGGSAYEPAGSGITMSKTLTRVGFQSMMQTTIHELGHYLMGGMEYHTGFGCWGMVSTYGIRMFVPNSFERHRLGWITLRTITADSTTLHGIQLPDYVTTGAAVRYVIDSTTGQYFYIENHQGISHWDRTMYTDSIERGVYVLRQDRATDSTYGPGSQLRLIPADGRYSWAVARMETNPCCGSHILPVFKRLAPNRHNGYHDCDAIPYTTASADGQHDCPVIIAENSSGATVAINAINGDGHDTFRPERNAVFSPWSNPTSQDKHRNSTGFGFEITGQDSSAQGVVYTLALYSRTAEQAAPALVQAFAATVNASGQPVLSWQSNEEPDLVSYALYRTPLGTNGLPLNRKTVKIATLRHRANRTEWVWTDTRVRTQAQRWQYHITATDNTKKSSVPVYTTTPIEQNK